MYIYVSEYLTPQNLSEITGTLETYLSMFLAHPMAVPCQVGPESNICSSAGLNISEEVVEKL